MDMPSLDDLRDAILFCREWLREIWKYPMAIVMCDPTISISNPQTETKIPELQQLFSQFWKHSLKTTNDASEKRNVKIKTKAIVNKISQTMTNHLQ